MDERARLSEPECEAALGRLFPQGFAGPDVLLEVAPEGWAASPLLRVFHPTAEQLLEESLAVHRNLEAISRRKPDESPVEPPTLEEIRRELKQDPVEPERELGKLIGLCLWDIFSDNHDVIDSDGRCVDLGSWRGSAGLIADLLNRQTGSNRFDYMHFYMGTYQVSRRADLRPVHAMLFGRLKAQGFDWEYTFPRIHLIDLRPLGEDRDRPDWEGYSPEIALQRDAEEREKEEEHRRMQDTLDEIYREEMEEAKHRPPPGTVEAYRSVFGRLPRGWPPRVDGLPAEDEG